MRNKNGLLCKWDQSSHNKAFFQFSIVLFLLSVILSLCCVCILYVFVSVSWVEEQKVSAGLACVGGLRIHRENNQKAKDIS